MPTNVVGIVIHTAPGRQGDVAASLAGMSGVDVHCETEDGRIVATAIDTDDVLAIDQLTVMNRMPGIVSAMLAYHEIDHPAEADGEAALACCGAASDPTHVCLPERA
jgi:nitrate reductase NapD